MFYDWTPKSVNDLIQTKWSGLTRNGQPQVNDILVVNKHYAAEAPDSFSLRRGDLVEVLETSVGTRTDTADAKYVHY